MSENLQWTSNNNNSLPSDIQSSPSPPVFRQRLKTFLFRQSFPTLLHLRGLRNSSAILATLEIFDWNWQQQLWLDLLDGIQWGPVDSVGKERPPCFGPSDTVGRRQCRQMTLARRRWWITVIEDLLHHSAPTTQHTLHTATYCSLDSAITKTTGPAASDTNGLFQLLARQPVTHSRFYLGLNKQYRVFHASTPNVSAGAILANPSTRADFLTIHTYIRLMALCLGLPGGAGTRKVKPIWMSLKQETVSGSGISWAICKSAPRLRQITMLAPHHSVFYRPNALPATQPTVSKHWRHKSTHSLNNLQMFSACVHCTHTTHMILQT